MNMNKTQKVKKVLIERFMSKVEESKDDEGCWDWKAGKFTNGYGSISIAGKNKLAHRVAYRLFLGPITENKLVCHKCDNKSCVNPDHLFLGDQFDNMRTVNKKGRVNGNAKLTESDIKYIKNSSAMNTSLARLFNVSPSTISLIKKGKTWKHVNEA